MKCTACKRDGNVDNFRALEEGAFSFVLGVPHFSLQRGKSKETKNKKTETLKERKKEKKERKKDQVKKRRRKEGERERGKRLARGE